MYITCIVEYRHTCTEYRSVESLTKIYVLLASASTSSLQNHFSPQPFTFEKKKLKNKQSLKFLGFCLRLQYILSVHYRTLVFSLCLFFSLFIVTLQSVFLN